MVKTKMSYLFVLLLTFGLAACGGGGDGGSSDSSQTAVATASLVLPQQLEVVTNETD